LNNLEERLLACEIDNARLHKRLTRQNTAWLLGLLLLVGGGAIAGSSIRHAVFDTVRAREIVVVDAKGTVRARMAGDLPDAVMAGGHVARRGTKAGGFVIYDEEGIERGGYATLDEGSNAVITLDSKHRMAVTLVAGPEPEQNSALTLATLGKAIEMRADANGVRLSSSDKTGLTFQQPAVTALSAASCGNYKELALKYPGERICQKRFSDSTCKACLGGE
jgi:hypothetical protein